MIISRLSIIINNQKPWFIELCKILGFGLLSLLMGQIKFYMPGIEGGSDLREIALIIGVFYLRKWWECFGCNRADYYCNGGLSPLQRRKRGCFYKQWIK